MKVLGGKSGWFKVGQGVRQGGVLPPWLFNVYMDHIVIMKEAKKGFSEGGKLEEV